MCIRYNYIFSLLFVFKYLTNGKFFVLNRIRLNKREKMKLTDMNIDCIQSCLKYLKLDDLLKTAASTKRLNHVSNFIYDRKYDKDVFIKITSQETVQIQQLDECIYMHDLRSSLKLLRCFGHLLSTISIHFSEFTYQHAIEYANEYCAKSLVEFG